MSLPTPGTSYSGWKSCRASLASWAWTASARRSKLSIWESSVSLGVGLAVFTGATSPMTM